MEAEIEAIKKINYEKKIGIQSKYIKPAREIKVFKTISVIFLFSLFVMPQYFGIALPFFDLTILRMMMVIMTILIIDQTGRKDDFFQLIIHSELSCILMPYLLVILYTTILRADIKAFLNPFFDIYALYLLVYLVRYELGVEKTIQYFVVFTYLLVILGLVEYVIGRSPFSYLETIKGIYTGRFIRSGHYRIMGPCIHSLGYGLLLVAVTPLCCIDLKKHQVSLLCHGSLLIMLVVNVFLTGSRSTLGVFVFELLILFGMSSSESKKKVILITGIALLGLIGYLFIFQHTSVAQYMLLQVTTLMDTVFGTTYSLKYGASASALSSSTNYRNQLMKIFQVPWLNPLLGIGRKRSFSCLIDGSYIMSIDNYYIAEYVRYAYPGLLFYLVFVGYFILQMIQKYIKEHSAICKAVLAGSVCYLVNIYWVDSLQTLKYLYILFALFYAYLPQKESVKEQSMQKIHANSLIISNYIRNRG